MEAPVNFEIKKMSLQLLVSDMNRSIEFYKVNFGFAIDFLYDDFYAGLVNDRWSIHLKQSEELDHLKARQGNREDLDIIFSVTGIEDLYKVLSDRSVTIVQLLRTMAYGKEFYIADPDGYVIGIFEM